MKQNTISSAIFHIGKTGFNRRFPGFKLLLLGVFMLSGLAVHSQSTTVTGGECKGCDASMSVKFIGCSCIEVSACKKLNKIVIRTANGKEIKFDKLKGHSANLCTPNGSPIVRVWVRAGCFKSGDGPGYGRRFDNPNPCAGACVNQGGDSDNDGVCDNFDCRRYDPAFPAPPGKSCDDGNPNTTNDVVTADGCDCKGTVGNDCESPAIGGAIGFGGTCDGGFQYCPTSGPPPIIESCGSPQSSQGELDIFWLQSTSSCTFLSNSVTADEIADGLYPDWTLIPNENGLSFRPFIVTQSTCYLRFIRLPGCSSYIRSNIISLNVDANCGGGGKPSCSNIVVTAGNGFITLDGLDKAPIVTVNISNSNLEEVVSCNGNCDTPSATYPLPAGTYYVNVKFFTDTNEWICEETHTVNVFTALQGSQAETYQFTVLKHEEHTELIYSHNGGNRIAEYVFEKSVNGTDFQSLSRHTSASGQQVYEEYDLEPVLGDNYYRVKMVRTDGSVYYSEVRLIYFQELPDYLLFPNPANGFVKVNLERLVGYENMTLTIFNSIGREVKRFEIGEIYGKYYQMDIRDLQEGQYVVWLSLPGKRPIAKKLTVSKG